MNSENTKIAPEKALLIHQSTYIKKLRPLLPKEAFEPDSSKLGILLINLAILILGWGIAANLERWPLYFLWLYLPLALIMGNSITVLLLGVHDLMHGSILKKSPFRYLMSFIGLGLAFIPPTLWKNVHNLVHHNHTNSLEDPDRNYLYEQPNTWGKWIQNLCIPSQEVHPFWFAVGMPSILIVYNLRHLTSVLLFNSKSVDYVPASFTVTQKDRWAIAWEFLGILVCHLTLLFYLGFHPLKLALAYFIPIGIGHSGAMFYIFTHHLMCRMTEVNDPLINSVSMRLPKLVDLLHFNFSYHTEHHIFPSMNSDYYPAVQELLETHYPGRMNLIDAGEAWRLLMTTPRHYKDEVTFVDSSGQISVSCPFDNSAIAAD